MLLSIGLMVRNESKHLEKCLRSLTPILTELDSELIVVDTGSTDNTVEIAQRFTDRVYHHEWFDDFAGMRNIVLSYAVGEWFLYVDGDEIIEDASGIIRFFRSRRHKKYNSAFIDIKNPYSSGDLENYALYQALRFFRKDKDFHFKGIIHEQPQAKGPVARIDGSIFHYGYLSDDKELMEYKFQRNVALINKVLEKEPDNIYHLYQLSQSYAMYGKKRQALKPIQEAYQLAKAKGLAKHMHVVTQLANVFFQNQMFLECEAVCEEGLGIRDGYMDLYYFRAMSQAELGKWREALSSFEDYLSLAEAYEEGKGSIDFTIAHLTVRWVERAYTVLCDVHKRLGNYRQAIDYANRITDPVLANRAVPNMIEIYLDRKDYWAAKELYEKWLQNENITRTIERAIERKRGTMDTDERQQLSEILADIDTSYGLLNLVRSCCCDPSGAIAPGLWEKVAGTDLRRRDEYYGDFVWFLIKSGKSIVRLLQGVGSDKISKYFAYVFGAHQDFLEDFKVALDNVKLWKVEGNDAHVSRLQTAALKAVLQQDGLSDEDYERFFRLYLDVGIEYVEACYNPTILDADEVSWAGTPADGFLMVMRRARTMDETSAEYVRCLRKALSIDRSLKRGVEILLQEAQNALGSPEQEEFNRLKLSAQEAIRNAINGGDLEIAASLIDEYQEIVGLDAPLCAAKGVMCMIDGQLEQAETILLTGLDIEPQNQDLLYNLGYLCELRGDTLKAIRYYEKARACAKAEMARSEIDEALVSLRSSQVQGDPATLDTAGVVSDLDEQIAVLQAALEGKIE